jgi:hypothetical protein
MYELDFNFFNAKIIELDSFLAWKMSFLMLEME